MGETASVFHRMAQGTFRKIHISPSFCFDTWVKCVCFVSGTIRGKDNEKRLYRYCFVTIQPYFFVNG